jgi:heme exporter protein A
MLEAVDLACARGERRLFEGLNFALSPGELLYVHGPNGAGKTTLLRAVCGLGWPEAGEIRWQGQNIRRVRDDYHRAMAYVGHHNGVKDDLSAYENLRTAARLAGGDADDERVLAALERMALTRCVELPGKVLSQGQKRRLALARLLVMGAVLWVLDEPFNALDVHAVGMVQTVLSEHLDNGGMVMFTTHQEVDIIADRARHVHLG